MHFKEKGPKKKKSMVAMAFDSELQTRSTVMAIRSFIFLAFFLGSLLFAAEAQDSWCVAQRRASLRELQIALDWACGPGEADCGPTTPGQPCFEPNNARAHASFAFNSYYIKHGKAPGTCNFNGAATLVYKDPSYGSCTYPLQEDDEIING